MFMRLNFFDSCTRKYNLTSSRKQLGELGNAIYLSRCIYKTKLKTTYLFLLKHRICSDSGFDKLASNFVKKKQFDTRHLTPVPWLITRAPRLLMTFTYKSSKNRIAYKTTFNAKSEINNIVISGRMTSWTFAWSWSRHR